MSLVAHSMLKELVYKNFVLRYQVIETGKKVMLAFHGAGGNIHQFKELLKQLPEYTCYSIALFGHESQLIEPQKPISQQDWNELMQLFLEKNHIKTFSVMAFSIGNRALTFTLQHFYPQIHQAILFAPDNIVISNWYKLATKNYFGKKIFNFLTNKNKVLLQLLNFTAFFYGKSTTKRWKKLIENPLQLRQISTTWWAYQHADFAILSTECLQTVNMTFVLGNKDVVVPTDAVVKKIKNIKKCRVLILPSHHYNLLRQFVRLKEFSVFE